MSPWISGSLRSGVSPPGSGSSGSDYPRLHHEVKPGALWRLTKNKEIKVFRLVYKRCTDNNNSFERLILTLWWGSVIPGLSFSSSALQSPSPFHWIALPPPGQQSHLEPSASSAVHSSLAPVCAHTMKQRGLQNAKIGILDLATIALRIWHFQICDRSIILSDSTQHGLYVYRLPKGCTVNISNWCILYTLLHQVSYKELISENGLKLINMDIAV